MATDPEHEGHVWLNWSWNDPYWTPNLDHWEVWPSYSYVDTNGSIRWMDMGSEAVDQTNPSAREWDFYWELPLSAEEVYFRLRPIAKNKSDGSPEWEEDFYTTETKYFGGATKPDAPSAPSVTQQSTLGIQVVLSLDNVLSSDNNRNVTKAEFQTVQYDSEFATGTVLNSVQGYVDDFGNIQAFTTIGTAYGYKFRARLWAAKERTGNPNDVTVVSSDWSELTELIQGAPERPYLKVYKHSNDKVGYEIQTKNAPNHFQLQIAPSIEVFNAADEWERENPSLKENSETRTAALLSLGIIAERPIQGDSPRSTFDVPASGQDFAVYRVRAVSAENDGFYSSWSEVTEDSTLIFSDGLRAPVIWSSTEFAEVGDLSMQLCIMHNSPNGSPACKCQIGWSINRETANDYWEWLDPPSGQSGNTVFYYNLDISGFDEETVIYWKARTFEGSVPIEENSSPMSEIKHFAIHSKPSIQLILDIPENQMDPQGYPLMTQYPLKYKTETTYYESVTNPIEIVSYEFNIIAAQTYRRYDKEGRLEVIKAGDVVYHLLDTTKYYDTERLLTAADVTLDDGALYYFQAIVALSNGSTGSTEYVDEHNHKYPGPSFKVDIEGATDYTIEVTHTRNDETVALYLNPSAAKYEGTGLGGGYYLEQVYFSGDLENITGNKIWSDGSNIYFSEGYKQYVFDSNSSSWSSKDWSGLTSFNGLYVWTDGTDIYYSYGSSQYILNKETSTWEVKEWFGKTSLYGSDIWTDGAGNIYLSNSRNHYVLDKETSTWEIKTWTGLTLFYAKNVWTDGENIYCSSSSGPTYVHYVLNKETSTWEIKTWNGYTSFTGDEIWNKDGNIFYSYGSTQLKLDMESNTFETFEWGDSAPDFGEYIWNDNNGITYYSLTGNGNFKILKRSSTPVRILPNTVTLAVYRKNDDGTFVKIDDNIPNNENLFITDPHPNLAGAEYRIVATDTVSGVMTYYDPPPIDMHCTDIILQWDEDYGNRPNNGDTRDIIPNLGNIIRLPYNVDVSESANIDNEMVKYVGRKDPVSYYGTHTGYTANWNTEIPKYDKETIKMLRKLQVFPGDVYVREPNGTGYWAHVTVTFPINHCALTVSVSISVTRVEGGK